MLDIVVYGVCEIGLWPCVKKTGKDNDMTNLKWWPLKFASSFRVYGTINMLSTNLDVGDLENDLDDVPNSSSSPLEYAKLLSYQPKLL